MKKKKEEPRVLELIQQTTQDILSKLKTEGTVEVKEEEVEDEKNYKVTIQTQETGLLIGHHGDTLNGLQLLLGVILYKKLKTWVHVIVDVGNYRQMREESIKEMVGRIVGEVETTKQATALPYLSPLERRIVHMMLTDHKTVVSESTGEGRDRRLMIKPRD